MHMRARAVESPILIHCRIEKVEFSQFSLGIRGQNGDFAREHLPNRVVAWTRRDP